MARFKFFGLGGKGKKEDKRKNPEEEGVEMIEMTEMSDLSEDAQEVQQEPEEEVQEDPEVRKQRDAARSELDFARSLYDSEPVKREGKKAFSKISTLLVRYNRLQEIKRDQAEEGEKIREAAQKKFKSIQDEVAEAAEMAKMSEDMTEEDRKKIDIKLKAKIENAKVEFDSEMERAKNVTQYLGPDVTGSLDKDRGGIRGALMLGGNSAFGKGYTMTDGSFEDVIKAGNYVKDVGGDEGTLMEQMSLLDNAVNTGGIDMDAGKKKMDTDGVAHANLSEIFRSITDEELGKLNSGNTTKLNLDMELIKKSRDDHTMDSLLGQKKEMKTLSEAAEKRGVFYQVEKVGEKEVKLRQKGLTLEAIRRKTGEEPGRYAKRAFPRMSKNEYRNATTFINRGFLGDIGSVSQAKGRTTGRNAEERRKNIRAARLAFNKAVDSSRKKYQENRFNKVNKKDKLADEMEMFRAEEIRSKEELVKAGLMDQAELDDFRKKDDVDIMQDRLKNAKKDNSAGHMLAAYKMMGASAQELLDFRLALIAYMVPIGKSTVAGIVNESHAVGVVGAEGPGNVEADADMSTLYSLLRKSAAYIQRKQASDEEKEAYKWSIDKKKFKKNEDGSIVEVEEKPVEEKKEPDKKPPIHRIVAEDAVFDTGDKELNKDPLFGEKNEISVQDVKQGNAEDSWLMAPLASLAMSDPDYIRDKLLSPQDDNLVQVRLYDEEGNYNFIVVSKNSVKGGSNDSALWVRVIEKAAAAFMDQGAFKEARKINMDKLKNGNIALGMTMLMGKGTNKQITIKKEDAQAGKEEVLAAIRDAITNKKVLTASTVSEPEKELRALGLNKDRQYTVLGEGKAKDGEETIRIRDTHGTATSKKVRGVVKTVSQDGQPVRQTMNIQLNSFEDGIIELKISDIVKYFTALDTGARIQDGKEEPEKEEKEEKQEKEELLDRKAAFEAMGAAEGIELIGKWQELGNKLWKLAYVEMGKEYLDSVLLHVDRLISGLSERLPSETDGKARGNLYRRHDEIAKEYNAIAVNGMAMASELPGKQFEGNDEAAAVVMQLTNLALEEGRYFNIGTSNTIRYADSSEALKERKPRLVMITHGKDPAKDGKAVKEERERRRNAKAPELAAEDLLMLFGDVDGEKEEPKQPAVQPVVQEAPPEEDKADKEQPEEKPEEQPQKKQAEVVQKPLDAQGYCRRWAELGDKFKELTDGKMRGMRVQFLRGFCTRMSKTLSGELPKNKRGRQTADTKEHLIIDMQYKEIREFASLLLVQLEEKKFEGSKEIAEHVKKILECAIEETELFYTGRELLTGKKSKGGLTWADALVTGRRDIEAAKEAVKFAKAAVIVEKGDGHIEPIEMKDMSEAGEAKPEEAPPKEEKGLFDDAEVLEKDGAVYIAAWKSLREKFNRTIGAMLDPKDKKQEELIKAVLKLSKYIDGLAKNLGIKVPVTSNGQKYIILKDMTRSNINIYRAVGLMGRLVVRKMKEQKMKSTEAAGLLRQIIFNSAEESKLLMAGMKAAVKQPPQNICWGDFLMFGKRAADLLAAKKKAAGAGKAAGGQPVEQPQEEEQIAGGGEQLEGGGEEQAGEGGEQLGGGEEQIGEEQAGEGGEQLGGGEEQIGEEQAGEGGEQLGGGEEQLGEGGEQGGEQHEQGGDQSNIEEEHPQEEEEQDKDDEELQALLNEEEPELDENAANKAIEDLEKEIGDGVYDEEDPNMDPEMKKQLDEMKALAKEQEKIHKLLTGEKDEEPKIRRTGTLGTAGRKKSKKKIARTNTADLTHLVDPDKLADKAAEMKALDKSAQIVGKQSFVPITTGGKVKNRVVLAAEYLWGTAMLPVNLVVAGISKLKLIYKKHKRPQDVQADREKENITGTPGRSSRSLEEQEAPRDDEGREQVLDDTRNVPLVWEFMTAGDPEEEPEMSINMEQPKPGKTTVSSGTDTGHGFITLSYSRFNVSTNRKERYKVEYGFYPKSEFGDVMSSMVMTTGAYFPGILKDDRDSSYTVSKTYTIDNEKVNKVLKASEKFPAEGYSVFKRNCVTFAVEMGKVAGIPIADQIKETEYETGKAAVAGTILAGGLLPSVRYATESRLEGLLSRPDTSYQDFGQKVVTTGELSRFKKTRGLMNSTPYGYAPSVAGEALRHDVAGGGEFGARLGIKSSNFENSVEISTRAIEHENRIADSFSRRSDEMFEGDKADQKKKDEVTAMVDYINQQKDGWAQFSEFAKDRLDSSEDDPEVIRETRKSLNDHRKKLGLFISKNPEFTDDCLNDIMQLMDIYELSIRMLDEKYEKLAGLAYTGELARIKSTYMNIGQTFTYTDSKGTEHEIMMEPNLVEAYIQIYGSIGKAAPHMARYTMYKDAVSEVTAKDRREALEEEYSDAVASYELAKQFADSHRYRLNRQSFDHDEIQYAFDTLPRMERPSKDENVKGNMITFKTTPSAMFQALIYGTAFKGFSGDVDDIRSSRSAENIAEWVDGKLKGCAQNEGNRVEIRRLLIYFYDKSTFKDLQSIAMDFIQGLNRSFIYNFLTSELDHNEIVDDVIQALIPKESRQAGLMSILMELLVDIQNEH